jgi:ribosome-associated protein
MEAKAFVEEIVKGLDKHKGEYIVSIDVRGKTEVADYYVVAGGRSMTHTRALIEHLEEDIDKLGIAPIRREGVREGRWAVLDYGDVIVHIFNDESRLFYHLEKLWGDEKNIERY